jgi:hypothetical protein
MSAPLEATIQLRNLDGSIISFRELTHAGRGQIEQALDEIAAEVPAPPQRSSLVAIVRSRVVRVCSAPQSLDLYRRYSTASILSYAILVAHTRSDMASEPQHLLIPPPPSMQRLYFGADSDEANIAAAALVDRLSMQLADQERTGGPSTDRQVVERAFELERDELESVFAEFFETDIADRVFSEALQACLSHASFDAAA